MIWPLSPHVVRGSHFSFFLSQESRIKIRRKQSIFLPSSISAEPTSSRSKLKIFKPQTQKQSIFAVIQPTLSDLVWGWHSLSSPSSTQSINIATDCWSLQLHHYSHRLSYVCMTMCVAYIRLLNVLVLPSVAVCAQLSVCLSSLLDNCCIAVV